MDEWMNERMDGLIMELTTSCFSSQMRGFWLMNYLLLAKFVIHFNDQKREAYIAGKSNGK